MLKNAKRPKQALCKLILLTVENPNTAKANNDLRHEQQTGELLTTGQQLLQPGCIFLLLDKTKTKLFVFFHVFLLE
jgi:hypothetical protein